MTDVEPVDLADPQPEAWPPAIPRWPGFALLTALLALPLLSAWLAGEVGGRLPAAAPEHALLEIWRGLTNASLVVGGVLVFIVPIATVAARRNPPLTQVLLGGGYQVGVMLVALAVLLHGALAFAIVLAVEWLVLGVAIPATASVLAFFALACAVYLLSIGLARLGADLPDLPAVRLARAEAPGLFERVDTIAGRLGARRPDAVLVGPEPGLRANRGTVRSLDGPIAGDTLEIGLPTLALLSAAELEAALAHELAHVANGDTEINARLVPAFGRIARSIESLETEANGIGLVAAQPAILWLRYAGAAMTAVVAEHLRRAEAAADASAAAAWDPRALASAMLAEHAVAVVEDEWRIAFRRALDQRDPAHLEAFRAEARKVLAGADARSLALDARGLTPPDVPALLMRLRALGMEAAEFALTAAPALEELFESPKEIFERLLDAIRSVDVRRDELRLNSPRLTPGLVGWGIVGLVFAGIFIVRLAADGPSSNWLQIVLFTTTLWLAFPLVYPRLQQEIAVDGQGIRKRSWWRRWLDLSTGAQTWRELRWTESMRLDVRFDGWLSVSNGLDSMSWWGGIWPRREVERLIDAVRERRVDVGFGRGAGFSDDERYAAIWSVGDRFLLPTIRRAPDGGTVEVLPVTVTRASPVRFTNALIDRVATPAPAARPRDRVAQASDLADAAGVDLQAFARQARELRVVGSREVWTVGVMDGSGRTWTLPRRASYHELADLIRVVAGDERRVAEPERGGGTPEST